MHHYNEITIKQRRTGTRNHRFSKHVKPHGCKSKRCVNERITIEGVESLKVAITQLCLTELKQVLFEVAAITRSNINRCNQVQRQLLVN